MFKPGDIVRHREAPLRGWFVKAVPESEFCYVEIKHQTWSFPVAKLVRDEVYERKLERDRVASQIKRSADQIKNTVKKDLRQISRRGSL